MTKGLHPNFLIISASLNRIRSINWPMTCVVTVIGIVGVGLLYSAGGNEWQPWATNHAIRLAVSLVLMITVAAIPLRVWFSLAYVFYIFALLLLIVVEMMGRVGMGAQRWIYFGVFHLQPSELMKACVVLATARYISVSSIYTGWHMRMALVTFMIMGLPAGLVLLQPNLGTAILILASCTAMVIAAGAPWWLFGIVGVMLGATAPTLWGAMHDYQKERVLTFLDPERDPLGAGYNIIQSKIALGSGGLSGKGLGEGTQTQLGFLPEKHTDFIFVLLAEETGLIGSLSLLALFTVVIIFGLLVAISAQSMFARFLSLGMATTIFCYVFVNVGMVTGLLPVVGIPLPLVSYGGTAMMTFALIFGILLAAARERGTYQDRSRRIP